ncbi:MAG: hypothetical protein UT84_C0003G0084 [Candidatus Curtissbacteria bacterium GW2011_GWA1_40_16]|uniref:Uncharacterized protein n=1 Tax=Candidatus Curtissbacteria bacterium GW2011_GWA1_40_16 TaxID=1618405 RepID=A0A0G0REJ1_9BACT|nr:MAG: hypothetical protein UT84_C0003G0084 [Candidatus Curtissbacteria bacterium GW2011_GWA1_40_16]
MPTPTAQTDDQKAKTDVIPVVAPATISKELEPQRAEEKKLLDEVSEASEQQDREAERKVQESLGKEARLSQPHPTIPQDVEDSGVVSPQKEASKTAAMGSTIELPLTEEEYIQGEKVKVSGSISDKGIIGVSSLAAFVMLIGRMIKLAHKHAKKVIFRKASDNGEGVNKNAD